MEPGGEFRRPSLFNKPGRPPETDWPSIINTDHIWSEIRGRDFKGTIDSRRTYLHQKARRNGRWVHTESRGDEIRYQFRSTE